MAEAIALVSIVSGAAVAVLVPFISARLERIRLTEQGRDVRIEELRALLDDALQHLYDAATIPATVVVDVQAATHAFTVHEAVRPRGLLLEGRLLGLGIENDRNVLGNDGLGTRLWSLP